MRGTTTFTPRLNLFRDSPIVSHGFSFFTSVIVFAFTAALAIGKDTQTTLLVPIQLASTLAAVARRGREVVDGMYPDPIGAGPAPHRAATGPASGRDVLWPSHGATLQIIDVRRLLRAAERTGAVIEVCVSPGEVIPEHGRVAVVHGGDEATEREAVRALQVGIERTFDQDPRLALRVLRDIALRSLSPAINDPTTPVQALDHVDGLLRVMMGRDLEIGTVTALDGHARVLLRLLTWEDYVGVALDETIAMSHSSLQVRGRLHRLLTELGRDRAARTS